MGFRWAAVYVLAGCYQPTIPAGAACSVDADCLGLPCVDNVCGGTSNTPPPPADSPAVTPDAAVDPDAPVVEPIVVMIGTNPNELRDAEILPGEGNLGAIDHFSVDDEDFGLLRFDLSSIPTSATILDAKLTLRTFDEAATDGGTILVHRLRQSWDEATVTWEKRNATQAWTTPGALPPSSDAAPIATMTPSAINTDYTVDLPAGMVQDWVSMPAQNFGLLFVVGTTQIHVHMRTRENSPHSRLTLTYRP